MTIFKKKESMEDRMPKSFPPPWSTSWGDNRLGLTAGFPISDDLDGPTLKLQFIEAAQPGETGFWISCQLDDETIEIIKKLKPHAGEKIILATESDCRRAVLYFNSLGYAATNDGSEPTPKNNTGMSFQTGRNLVIPDYKP